MACAASKMRPVSSVVDPDPYWIRIQELSGSGFLYNKDPDKDPDQHRIKLRLKGVRFKI